MDRIYFDNGSTSFPKAPGTAEAMASFIRDGAFNINRGNYSGAYETESMVRDTRELLAELFHAPDARNVIFTSGITCSVNMFLKGLLKPGDHIVTSSMEHNAVMRPLAQLEKKGVAYTAVPVNREGILSPADLERAVRPDTKVVIINHASNVSGSIQPIREIGMICRRHNLYYGVDTAQSAGTLDVNFEECCMDFLGFTGHKGLLGPQGTGGFIISSRLAEEMIPLIAGGTGSRSDSLELPETMPDKYESGTMNIPGIAGLNASLLYLKKTGIEELHKKKMALARYFLEALKPLEAEEILRVPGPSRLDDRVAVVSVDFLHADNAAAAFALEEEAGVMTRVGLHCAPMAHKAIGTFPRGTVRFAFSAFNTKEEIDTAMAALQRIISPDYRFFQ